MKKILTTLSLATVIATTANADFLRIEMGAGGWQQTPSGYAKRTDGDGALSLDGTYTSTEKESNEFYIWALLKHPIPIIPNIRAEYVGLQDEGDVKGKVNGQPLPPLVGGHATVNADQYDLIPYYNLLDNTFWITLDLGLDIRYLNADATVVENVTKQEVYSGSDSVVIPLVYARGRVDIPATNLGAEANVKYITDGDSTVYDIQMKVDYLFDFSPAIHPGLEVGYRMLKYDLVDGSNVANLEFNGLYAGVMLHF